MKRIYNVLFLQLLFCPLILCSCSSKENKEKEQITKIESVLTIKPEFSFAQDYSFFHWQDPFLEEEISYNGKVKVSDFRYEYGQAYLVSEKIFENGLLTENYSYSYEPEKEEYIYNPEKKLIKINSYHIRQNNMEFSEEETVIFEYDEESENPYMNYNLGNRIFKKITRKNIDSGYEFTTEQSGEVEDIRTYIFDSEGRVSKFTSTTKRMRFAPMYVTDIRYNKTGQIVSILYHAVDNQGDTLCYEYIYEYDEADKLTKKIIKNFDRNNPEIYQIETYNFFDFDQNGNWRKYSYENEYGEVSEYTRKIEYYD